MNISEEMEYLQKEYDRIIYEVIVGTPESTTRHNETKVNMEELYFIKSDLEDMGFELTEVSEMESGGDAFDYYTLDAGPIKLISDAFIKGEDSRVSVQLMDDDTNLSRGFIEAITKEFK